MTRHDDATRLRHMLDHAMEAVQMALGRTRADLDADRVFNLAMTRLLEIVGEAAAHVSPATRDQHPEVPWPAIVGMRNRLIHGYDAVDFDTRSDLFRPSSSGQSGHPRTPLVGEPHRTLPPPPERVFLLGLLLRLYLEGVAICFPPEDLLSCRLTFLSAAPVPSAARAAVAAGNGRSGSCSGRHRHTSKARAAQESPRCPAGACLSLRSTQDRRSFLRCALGGSPVLPRSSRPRSDAGNRPCRPFGRTSTGTVRRWMF